jgi:WD40 repeat protein
MGAAQGGLPVSNLFISYSRKDKEAARRLCEKFESQELDTWIDWNDIPISRDWRDEIRKGIEEADVFVFLISPDSCRSVVCKEELAQAVENGKRLIPVVIRETNPAEVPPELGSLNWTLMRPVDDFEAAFEKMVEAIRTDFDWVQTQRRLQVRALEWEKRNDNSRLLRGRDLLEAEEQLAGTGQKDPLPTALQRRYVFESRRGESRRRNFLLVGGAVVIVALALLSLYAFNQSTLARNNEATAVANAAAAGTQKAIAQTNQQLAEQRANIALARQLASKSQGALLINHDRRLSLLYAIEAIRAGSNIPGFENTSAAQPIYDAIYQTGGKVLVNPVGEAVVRSKLGMIAQIHVVNAINEAGDRLAVAYQDHTVHVWDLDAPDMGPAILDSSMEAVPDELLFDPTGRFLVASQFQGGIEVWDLKHSSQSSQVFTPNQGSYQVIGQDNSGPTFSPDGQWLVVWTFVQGGPVITVLNLFHLEERQAVSIPGVNRKILGLQSRWLITVDKQSQIPGQLWDLQAAQAVPATLPQEAYACPHSIVSPNGNLLATDCNRQGQVWDIQDPFHPVALLDPLSDFSPGAFSPNSSRVAFVSPTGNIRIVDLQAGGQAKFIDLFETGGSLKDPAFSPDSRWIAAFNTGSVFVSDLSSRGHAFVQLNGLGGLEMAVQSFAFTADSLHLVSVSDDGVARRWDLLNPYGEGSSPRTTVAPAASLEDLSFDPSGRWLAVTDTYPQEDAPYSNLVDVRNFSAGPVTLPVAHTRLFFPPSDNELVSTSKQGDRIYRWKLTDIARGETYPASVDIPGKTLPATLDTRWLVSQLEDGALQVWDLWEPDREPRTIRKNNLQLDATSRVLTNARWFWTMGQDNTMQGWDSANPDRAPGPWPHYPPDAKYGITVKVSPAGNWLAVADLDIARVWDLRKPGLDPVLTIPVDARSSFGVNGDDVFLFSHDERWLIVSHGTKIQLVDLQNPAADPLTLGGQGREVQKLALSADGHLLAGSSLLNGEIRVWNLQDLISEPILLQQDPYIDGLSFSPDGKGLAVAHYTTLDLLRLDPLELMQLACNIVGSNLSRQQWEKTFPPEQPYQKTCPQWPEGEDPIVTIMTG